MINLNCDVGEGINNEHLLMPYLSSCSIACGGHAGDLSSMEKVVDLAIEHNVAIGAHPSYPDKTNFGRVSMNMEKEDLIKSLGNQVFSLKKILEKKGQSLHHVKAHGALYNDMVNNRGLTEIFIDALTPFMPVKIYTPSHSVISKIDGLDVVFEVFADRNYNDDLSLVSRTNQNAVLTYIKEIIEHVYQIHSKGRVKTISGTFKPFKADTFCVHSDSPNADKIVKSLYEHFSN